MCDSGEDITKLKDGGIRKSILEKGEGLQGPNDGGTCTGNIALQTNMHRIYFRFISYLLQRYFTVVHFMHLFIVLSCLAIYIVPLAEDTTQSTLGMRVPGK